MRIERTIFSSQRAKIYEVRGNDGSVYAMKVSEDVARFDEKYDEYVGLRHKNVCRVERI